MTNSIFFFLDEAYEKHLKKVRGITLTQQQVNVLACKLHGLAAKETARVINMASEKRVYKHLENLRGKLDSHTLRDFIETSDKLTVFRAYYDALLIHKKFREYLQKISKLPVKPPIKPFHVLVSNEQERAIVFSHLQKDLKEGGLDCKVISANHNPPDHEKTSNKVFVSFKPTSQHQNGSTAPVSTTSISNFKDYYELVFEMLKSTYSRTQVATIQKEFEQMGRLKPPPVIEASENIISNPINDHTPKHRKQRWLYGSVSLVLFLVMGSTFFWLNPLNLFNKFSSVSSIRSELIIPTDSVLLERSEILNKIDAKLKEQEGIKTIALIGIGGAGKTTLARQYAKTQKHAIVWEINAETQDSLKHDFEALALALCNSEEQRSELSHCLELKNQSHRETKLLSFVKKNLSTKSPWTLLFDNIEDLAPNLPYIPSDKLSWGSGNVILTTRNQNISNNSFLDGSSTLHTGHLTQKEIFGLFTRIAGKNETDPFQKTQLMNFLKKLPPFPLDIVTTAYFIKDTKISYDDYLNRVTARNNEFESYRANLIREKTGYPATRYGIVSLSFEQTVSSIPEIMDLLVYLSILDSQNISKNLLCSYGKKEVVEKLIHTLRKHSFITSENKLNNDVLFSIHRSVQEILSFFLSKKLPLKEREKIVNKIVNKMNTHIQSCIEEENMEDLKILKLHLLSTLHHSLNISPDLSGHLLSNLGSILYFLGDFTNAENTLKKSLLEMEGIKNKPFKALGWAYEQLADLNSELGNYNLASELFHKSLLSYKQSPSDETHNIARVTANMGYVDKELGRYAESEKGLLEALKIYLSLPHDNVGIAWTYLCLGYLYDDLGNYSLAKTFYEKGLKVAKKYLPKDHSVRAWILTHLGNLFLRLGDNNKAETYIAEAEKICLQHFSETHVGYGAILTHKGNLSLKKKKYKDAKTFYNESRKIFLKHYKKDHMRIARTLRKLAKVSCYEKNYSKAENLLNESLTLYKTNNHPDKYKALETLADLTLEKTSKNRKLNAKLQILAAQYLNDALGVLIMYFPSNSPHITRIKTKLKKLTSEPYRVHSP